MAALHISFLPFYGLKDLLMKTIGRLIVYENNHQLQAYIFVTWMLKETCFFFFSPPENQKWFKLVLNRGQFFSSLSVYAWNTKGQKASPKLHNLADWEESRKYFFKNSLSQKSLTIKPIMCWLFETYKPFSGPGSVSKVISVVVHSALKLTICPKFLGYAAG